jgi:predicted ester cyclase
MSRLALSALVLYAALSALPAAADDRVLVRSFYDRLLNGAGGIELEQRAVQILASDWATRGNNNASGDIAGFVKGVTGFTQAVPNLKWEVMDILNDGPRYIVRGRATGTPVKPFLGVEPTGKSFDIMSIDIHTVRNGKIVESYHVEDWAGAIRQLRAQ